ncbi:hypothetical protein DMA15_03485 [Streptomyces sp. WAC 01529]|uniref:hypothetical protein n=1 Tax=Streptomyces sp. WAC 01529 TaxID=2203205 RepID=UPI000F710C42|nr:hypothetical protein [Streptomyces sp. WAC 01529]AZM51755.1 hypothetical protein DMA15_03485 [Streptomyces sp. WAC 01529]
MTGLSHLCNDDFRNEGWGLAGSLVSRLFHCWNNDDDSKYCWNPPHKGRACVRFPVDIGTVPEGAVITSVTVKVRARKMDSQNRTLTINVSCLDDTSRFTSRTIPLTQTITDYEVATYQRDPLGHPWDIHRLNKLLCQVFSYAASLHCIRVYKVWVQINYRVRPTVTVEAPTGTVLTPSPVISWTYAQADGDPQAKAEYRVFTGIQVAESTFAPNTTPPVYAATVGGDITSLTLPTSINPDQYSVYVRVYSSFGAKSIWVGRAFAVQGPSPGVPGDDHTVSGTPGIGVVSVVPDSYASAVALTLRDSSNLLSVQSADFETLTDAPEYTTTNCTAAQDTSTYFAGVASLKLTASSAATMSVLSPFVELAPGSPVTVRAQLRAAVTARACSVRIRFYDDTFTALAGTVTGTGTDSSSTWTEAVATGTSPAATVYAKVEVEVESPALAEIHHVDHVGLMYGAGAPWSDGGHTSRNILPAFSATGDDPVGDNWVAGAGSTISRVAVTGTGSHGTLTKRLTYTGITPSLGFRATGTAFTSPTSGTDFTLNKPAGVVVGDLMVAFVSSNQFGTITPPAGWAAVNTAAVDDGTTDAALWILKRTAGGSDPATWTDGTLGTASTRRCAVVVAYTGAADAADQFIAEGVLTRATGTPLYLTSAVLNNTDANAWRLSAFAVSDNVTGGAMVANIAPPTTSADIAYVGKGTAWTTASNATSYVINRPSGVVSGDLMVATVAISDSVIATLTAPTGWTVVRQITEPDGTASLRFAVLKRTAGGSEPSSWTGTLSATVKPIVTQVSAYRNADSAANQFIAEDTSQSGSGNTVATSTVTNTDSRAWRISAFGSSGDYYTEWGSTTEVAERSDNAAEYQISYWQYRTAALMMADSNGPVGTGSHSRTGSLNRNFYGGASWIGIIKPLPSAPAAGANETERSDVTVGSSDPWLTTGVYDSNGVVPVGATSVTAAFTPGSGSEFNSAASWVGLVKPAVPLVAGRTVATMPDAVEVSGIDPQIMQLADNKVTFTSGFLGSSSGTPYLTLHFYRANQLISSQTIQGTSFGTATWAKSSGTYDIPEGTTRIKGEVSVTDRAVSDLVYFDRVGIMLGPSGVWRNGTGRSTHAVWHAPVIEYADDVGTGYGDWQVLPGLDTSPPAYDPLSGIATYTDHTVIPLVNRRYRAQTISFGLAGDRFVSGFGPPSDEVSLTALNWWLKDITNPDSSIPLRVKAEPLQVGTTGTSVMYQPLGEDRPVVVSEGYKGDAIELTLIVRREEYAPLRALLRSGRTLFLQTNVDHAWWVRPVGDISAEVQVSGQRFVDPLRFVQLTFVEVAAPE